MTGNPMRTSWREADRLALVLAIVIGASACGDGQKGAQQPPSPDAASTAGETRPEPEPPNPPDGPVRVTLSAAAATTAHITVEVVRAETTSASSSGLDVPGQVDYDPSRVAIISPRIAGRIERLAVVEGTHVGTGQTVAFISSPVFLNAQADLQQAARRAALLGGTASLGGSSSIRSMSCATCSGLAAATCWSTSRTGSAVAPETTRPTSLGLPARRAPALQREAASDRAEGAE